MAIQQITANEIADGTVIAADIADGTVTFGKIASGTIKANNIGSGQITGNLIGATAIGSNNIVANTDTVTTLSIAAGAYGNSTVIPTITVAANGRVTAISNNTVVTDQTPQILMLAGM